MDNQRVEILKDLDLKIDAIEQKVAKQREMFQTFFSEERDIMLKVTEQRVHNVIRDIFIKLIILLGIIYIGIILLRFLPGTKAGKTK